MKLSILKFNNSEINQLSEKERIALFQFGHLHNELMWTQKHLLWVWNQPQNEEASQKLLNFKVVSCLPITKVGRQAKKPKPPNERNQRKPLYHR